MRRSVLQGEQKSWEQKRVSHTRLLRLDADELFIVAEVWLKLAL